ncbi:MAG: hypothetical protein ACLQG3_16645 [Terracidiphilus sp.]
MFRQRIWNQFTSGKGTLRGVLPYYQTVLSEVVIDRGPGDAFERVRGIIAGGDQLEIAWLTSVLSQWKARGKKVAPIRKDWRDRATEAIGHAETQAMKAALENPINAI